MRPQNITICVVLIIIVLDWTYTVRCRSQELSELIVVISQPKWTNAWFIDFIAIFLKAWLWMGLNED